MEIPKINQLYRHTNSQDCAIMPLDILTHSKDKEFVVMKLQTYNIVNTENIYPIGDEFIYKIAISGFKEWYQYGASKL